MQKYGGKHTLPFFVTVGERPHLLLLLLLHQVPPYSNKRPLIWSNPFEQAKPCPSKKPPPLSSREEMSTAQTVEQQQKCGTSWSSIQWTTLLLCFVGVICSFGGERRVVLLPCKGEGFFMYQLEPHKAVAEVSKIGNL